MPTSKDIFPPHGFVRHIEHCGDELAIVNAARVSLAKESQWNVPDVPEWENPELQKALSSSDAALIRYLMKNKHGSPFEHGFLSRWHIRLPIFVMREWVRHRIGFSVNEESGRYVELRPDFYIPHREDVHTQEGKPGAYTFVQADPEIAAEFIERLGKRSEEAYADYKWALDSGISKEDARMFLPLNLYTEMRWTANARNLMNFLELRNNENAMYEIRKYARAIEEIFAYYMPTVHQAFLDNGRVAP